MPILDAPAWQLRSREKQEYSGNPRAHHTADSCTSADNHNITDLTPPLTPAASYDGYGRSAMKQSLHFYDYLRAAYPYHPPWNSDSSTVTIPLNKGDIVLVHSVHSNGWADGTLLDSGRRGWLPTNHCEAFDPESLRDLMRATTTLWDAVKDCCEDRYASLNSRELMRGVIAGVRCFLVRWPALPQ